MEKSFEEEITPFGFIYEKHYAETMEKVVEPYLKEHRTEHMVDVSGTVRLYAEKYQADEEKGTVLILHGFTENTRKYAEMVFGFLKNGYTVGVFDQRGHGKSWRDPKVKDETYTDIDRFENYVEDLFRVKKALFGEKTLDILFGHSMGGAVAILALEQDAMLARRAILCSPMVAPQTGGLPVWVTNAICVLFRMIGQGRNRVFVSSHYNGHESFEAACSTSPVRFEWYDNIKFKNPEYQNSSPTYRWLQQSLRVEKMILAEGQPEKIAIPVRLYTAETEEVVRGELHETFIRRVKQGTRQIVKGAKHEIYRSPDSVTFPWWEDILAFITGK